MDNIIVVGISGHARVIIDVIEKQGKYKLVGMTDKSAVPGTEILGYPVLGADEDIPDIARTHTVVGGIVAVGDNWLRSRLAERIRALCPAFEFVNAIHPSSQLGKNATIGEGTVVMAGAVVNPCCRVGRFCILNT